MAPEAIQSLKKLNATSDTFSACVCLYLLLRTKYPFPAKYPGEIIQEMKTKNLHFEFSSRYWTNISYEAKSFLTVGLKLNVESRISCQHLSLHPWLKNESNLPVMVYSPLNKWQSGFYVSVGLTIEQTKFE